MPFLSSKESNETEQDANPPQQPTSTPYSNSRITSEFLPRYEELVNRNLQTFGDPDIHQPKVLDHTTGSTPARKYNWKTLVPILIGLVILAVLAITIPLFYCIREQHDDHSSSLKNLSSHAVGGLTNNAITATDIAPSVTWAEKSSLRTDPSLETFAPISGSFTTQIVPMTNTLTIISTASLSTLAKQTTTSFSDQRNSTKYGGPADVSSQTFPSESISLISPTTLITSPSTEAPMTSAATATSAVSSSDVALKPGSGQLGRCGAPGTPCLAKKDMIRNRTWHR